MNICIVYCHTIPLFQRLLYPKGQSKILADFIYVIPDISRDSHVNNVKIAIIISHKADYFALLSSKIFCCN